MYVGWNKITLQLPTTRQNKAWPRGQVFNWDKPPPSVVFHVFPSSPSSVPLVQRKKSRKCLLPIAEVLYSFLIDGPSTRFLIPSYPKLLLWPHREGFVSGWDRIKGKERDSCMHVINRNLQKKVWWFAVLHNIQFALIKKIKLIEELLIQSNWLSSGMWTY